MNMATRKETHQRKSRKKPLVAAIVAVGLLAGSAQAYAVTQNTSLLALVKSGIASIQSLFLKKTDDDLAALKDKYRNEVNGIADDAANKMMNGLSEYEKSEIGRADQAIGAHLNDVRNQLQSAIDQESAGVKKAITDRVDKGIADTNAELDKELEKALDNKLKQK